MSGVMFWFGVVHAVAYTAVGFSLMTTVVFNWLARKLKLKADIVRALMLIWDERRAPSGETLDPKSIPDLDSKEVGRA